MYCAVAGLDDEVRVDLYGCGSGKCLRQQLQWRSGMIEKLFPSGTGCRFRICFRVKSYS